MARTFQYQFTCLKCKKSVSSKHNTVICDECSKKPKGGKRKMVKKKVTEKKVTEKKVTERRILQNSNPEGFNKFKKNPKPVEVVKTYKDVVDLMTTQEIINKIKELFREQWIYKRKVLSLGQKMSMLDEKLFDKKSLKAEAEKIE